MDRLAHHLGGTRVLALPLLRVLAVLLGIIWVLLAPADVPARELVRLTVLAFALSSTAIIVALWLRPGPTLRRNFLILMIDLAAALLLVWLTGGARSGLFPALLLIAGLQSYYYGIKRGVTVAVGSAVVYLALAWPTLSGVEWANIVVRLSALVGTAVALGILADLESGERVKVATLTSEARARERFIRSVVESLREGVVALDRDGRVVAWNAAAEARSGLAADTALGRSFFDCLPGLRRAAVEQPLGLLLRGEIEDFTLEAIEDETSARGRAVFNLKGSLLRLDGRPAGAVLLTEDITDRVALERSARQTEKLAALGTLAAGLAHELNNPIGIISSRIELMLLDTETRPLPDDVREDLHVLHRHAQRVTRIAQGLLSFSRQSPGQHGPVDLNRLVEETLLLVEKTIVKDGITLRRSLTPGLPLVWGDANTLQQVLMNLLTNARDALRGGGEIQVGTDARPGQSVRLVVRDTGPGIPPEVLSRIFDPFFTTKTDGTGLGLSISYGIVRDHQGTLDVESLPDKGTTFALTFPAEKEPA
jgi:PAS domain S-box-containing protein